MKSHQSRRAFLECVGASAAFPAALGSFWEKEPAPYPPYPSIPETVLDEQGWKMRQEDGEWRNEKHDALWSIRSYEWVSLRERIREKTGGVIDIPVGGLIAMRIGNNGTTRKLFGDMVRDGQTFLSSGYARYKLSDAIRETYMSFIDSFSKVGFNRKGELNWNLSPALPTSYGFYSSECHDGGSLTTEAEGSVRLTQHILEYPLRSNTVNVDEDVSITDTEYLEFHGWVGSWIHQDNIYAVVGVHPNDQSSFCGLTDPHVQNVLEDTVEGDVDLGLEESLYGRLHTVMGAVE